MNRFYTNGGTLSLMSRICAYDACTTCYYIGVVVDEMDRVTKHIVVTSKYSQVIFARIEKFVCSCIMTSQIIFLRGMTLCMYSFESLRFCTGGL